MKNLYNKIAFIAIIIIGAQSLSAQVPPPPPSGGHGQSGNSSPSGGGAPIGSGVGILLALGAAYGGKKIHTVFKNKESIED